MATSVKGEEGAPKGESAGHGAASGHLAHGDPPQKDTTLQHPRCVFQIVKRHYSRYTPELVAEIAFNDLQASPHYPGGLALRFARLKRYRPDKSASDADTIDAVRAHYAAQARAAR